MNKSEFKEFLTQHGLTVNQFLDLRDEWNQLPAHDRCTLLEEEDRIKEVNQLDAETLQAKIDEAAQLVLEAPKKYGVIADSPVWTAPVVIDVPDSCKQCPNHPSNGGSGVCHCILGH